MKVGQAWKSLQGYAERQKQCQLSCLPLRKLNLFQFYLFNQIPFINLFIIINLFF